jgi:hypothetical protein
MIDSRGRAVRRWMRRAIRAGSPDARASFLRSSPGHIASARVSTSAAVRRCGNLLDGPCPVLLVLAGAPPWGVRRMPTIRWRAETDLSQT